MKYFTDGTCYVRSPDSEADQWIKDGLTEITEAEYLAFTTPPPPPRDDRIETAITSRLGKAIRDAVKAGTAAGFIAALKAMVDEEEAKL